MTREDADILQINLPEGWILLMNVRIVILAYLITFFLLPTPHAAAQDKIRLGHSSIGATNGSFWVADEKGLFKKHGVDVEVIFIGGGGARVVSALLAGDIHFSVGGGEGSIRSQ